MRAPTIRWEMARKEGAPTIGYEIGLRWAVDPDATAQWRFSVTGIEHLGVGRHGMGKKEQAIVDGIGLMFEAVEGRGAVPASGIPVFEQTAGLNTQPSLPAVLDMLTVPLPLEPVGVGARWEVTDPDEDGGSWGPPMARARPEAGAGRGRGVRGAGGHRLDHPSSGRMADEPARELGHRQLVSQLVAAHER